MLRLLFTNPLAASLLHGTTVGLRDAGTAAATVATTLTVGSFFATRGPGSSATISTASPLSSRGDDTSTRGRPPFKVCYLVGSCGLTLEAARTAAKKLCLYSPEKPDAVLALLRGQGFTKTQIAKLVAKWPSLLLSDPAADLKPTLDFFLRLGFTAPALAKLVSTNHRILKSDLQNKIIPGVDLLRAAVGTDEGLRTVLSRNSFLLRDVRSLFSPKIEALKRQGVPDSRISKLIVLYPRTMSHTTDRFRRAVEKVREMGFDPSSASYVWAVAVFCGVSRSFWEKKLAFYGSLGWSEDEALLAFRKHPNSMLASEDKIRQITGILGGLFNWGPAYLSARSTLLNLSFENRILPRASVLEVLRSRGLLRTEVTAQVFFIPDVAFSNLYVVEYQKDVPEVLEAQSGKLELQQLWNRKKQMELKQLSD